MISGAMKEIKKRQNIEMGRGRRNKRPVITFDGKSGTVQEWINELGISRYDWDKMHKQGFNHNEVIAHYQKIAEARRKQRVKKEKEMDANQCSS